MTTPGGALATNPQSNSLRKANILGLNISPITSAGLFDAVSQAVRVRSRLRIAFCSVDTIVQSQRNQALTDAINDFEIACPDGMPLVWLSKMRGFGDAQRVDGPNSMLAICERGVPLGFRHYFYGSTPAMLEALKKNLEVRFPGIQIAGSYSPPFRDLTEQERVDAVKQINMGMPDLVWVGLGMPKQEIWVAENSPTLEPPVILAVGAAFGFTAGMVRRAPRWMQQLGLEWLFRLSQEPRRLWKRYLLGNPFFVWLIAKDLLLRRIRNRSP